MWGHRRGKGEVSPEKEFKPLLKGQKHSLDQVTAAALLKYGQKCT